MFHARLTAPRGRQDTSFKLNLPHLPLLQNTQNAFQTDVDSCFRMRGSVSTCPLFVCHISIQPLGGGADKVSPTPLFSQDDRSLH